MKKSDCDDCGTSGWVYELEDGDFCLECCHRMIVEGWNEAMKESLANRYTFDNEEV